MTFAAEKGGFDTEIASHSIACILPKTGSLQILWLSQSIRDTVAWPILLLPACRSRRKFLSSAVSSAGRWYVVCASHNCQVMMWLFISLLAFMPEDVPSHFRGTKAASKTLPGAFLCFRYQTHPCVSYFRAPHGKNTLAFILFYFLKEGNGSFSCCSSERLR